MFVDDDQLLTQAEEMTAAVNQDTSPAIWQCALCPKRPIELVKEFGVDRVRLATFPQKENIVNEHMKERYVHHRHCEEYTFPFSSSFGAWSL